MRIIPRIETPVSENYITFEKNLIYLLDAIKRKGLSEQDEASDLPHIIIEQNFGVNSLLICKDLKNNYEGIKVAYAFNMRDKNRISMLSDLLTLKQIDVKDIIASEGIHPLKTVFNSAKPVYDLDVIGLFLILKRGIMNKVNGVNGINTAQDGSSFFNLGVIVGASAAVDGFKVKKLIDIGADRFVINYNGGDIDENIIKFIKSKEKEVLLSINESDIATSLKDFIKTNERFKLDGIIIKIMDETANIFIEQ